MEAMKTLAAILLVLTLQACAPRAWEGDETPRPLQAEATAMAWAFYGAPGEAPPVLWRSDSECGDGIGWRSDSGACVQGQFFGDWHVELADDPGEMHATNLAHELCHAAQYALTGDPDSDHRGVCFVRSCSGAHAECLGLSDQARVVLDRAGL